MSDELDQSEQDDRITPALAKALREQEEQLQRQARLDMERMAWVRNQSKGGAPS